MALHSQHVSVLLTAFSHQLSVLFFIFFLFTVYNSYYSSTFEYANLDISKTYFVANQLFLNTTSEIDLTSLRLALLLTTFHQIPRMFIHCIYFYLCYNIRYGFQELALFAQHNPNEPHLQYADYMRFD